MFNKKEYLHDLNNRIHNEASFLYSYFYIFGLEISLYQNIKIISILPFEPSLISAYAFLGVSAYTRDTAAICEWVFKSFYDLPNRLWMAMLFIINQRRKTGHASKELQRWFYYFILSSLDGVVKLQWRHHFGRVEEICYLKLI